MKRRCIAGFILVFLLLIASVAGGIWYLRNYLDSPLLITGPVLFTVPAGSGRETLSDKLNQQNIIKSPVRLLWMLRTSPRQVQLKAGTYRLQPGMTIRDLLVLLNSGKEAQFPLRIIEGTRLSDVLAQLRNAPYIKHNLKNDDYATVSQELNIPIDQLEGHFWPDTWFYTVNTSDIALLRRAYDRMQRQLAQIWHGRASGLPYDNAAGLLIMASIIEKETGQPDERPHIASVFINRLHLGMRLQTDPTVIYGMGTHYQGKITRKHLQTPTPYNTYIIFGLPPTPIAIPGADSLKAAAHPAKTPYLYFVANGKGGHTFSTRLTDHNAAVRHYLKELKQKNEQ